MMGLDRRRPRPRPRPPLAPLAPLARLPLALVSSGAARVGVAPAEEPCEARLGRLNRIQRPDLPLPSEVRARWPARQLAARLDFTGMVDTDFRLFNASAGLEAHPLPGVSLLLRWQDRAGAAAGAAARGRAGRGLRLQELRLRTPSEHRLNGTRYAGELQLVHANEEGAVVVLAWLLKGVPRFRKVPYPQDCPAPYQEIMDQATCKGAAVELDLQSAAQAGEARIVGLKEKHRKSGCWAVLNRETGNYDLMLEPEVTELNFDWRTTVQLCVMGAGVSDWITDLARPLLNGSHTALEVARLQALLESECSWFQAFFDERCHISFLAIDELLGGATPALHYSSNLTRMKRFQEAELVEAQQVERLTFRVNRSTFDGPLGFEVHAWDRHNLTISSIGAAGALAEWTRRHPALRPGVGDQVVRVNGEAGDSVQLVSAMLAFADFNVTVLRRAEEAAPARDRGRERGRGAAAGGCGGAPVEWLVASVPLPVDMMRLSEAQAAGVTSGMKAAWEELFVRPGTSGMDVVTLLPPEPLLQRLTPPRPFRALAATLLCLAAVGAVGWGLLLAPGEYEPDLGERTRHARWALVREHGVACVLGWLMVPLFLAQRLDASAAGGWRLPFACHMYLNAAVAWHLLLELWYLWATGCARKRLLLQELATLLLFDALAVVDLLLDMLAFCVAYLAGSPLCWCILSVFLLSRVVQWCLGAVLAYCAEEEALIHWQPRQMLLMHTVVIRQLIGMHREEELRQHCLWLLLPFVKCALEDLPQLGVQLVFCCLHGCRPVLALSLAASAASVVCSSCFALRQAFELQISAGEAAPALHSGLRRCAGRWAECAGRPWAAADARGLCAEAGAKDKGSIGA